MATTKERGLGSRKSSKSNGLMKRRDTKTWDHNVDEAARMMEETMRNSNWKRWGPYLSERQWGTVREDYSADGSAWDSFPHDHARKRTYRWGEDGLMGISDRQCRLCFCLALWNGKDPILKERLFGLTGSEGNHGEDVKELYYYLESTPTHSYMKGLYKYPQGEYPYGDLIESNRGRSREELEYEIEDTGAFEANAYWDVEVEYAKGGPNDLLIHVHLSNRADEPATLHFVPQLWFRNTWAWGHGNEEQPEHRPTMHLEEDDDFFVVKTNEASLGRFDFVAEKGGDFDQPPEVIFTENETNFVGCFGAESNPSPYTKDAFHRYVVDKEAEAVNPDKCGTKGAVLYKVTVPAGETRDFKFRLFKPADMDTDCPLVTEGQDGCFDSWFQEMVALRATQSAEFYLSRLPPNLTENQLRIQKQAYAGMLWSKQFFYYIVKEWLKGDPNQPTPPGARLEGRNSDWGHIFNRDIISMPDKWEYPWYAAWDLAFHTLPFCVIDPEFAKNQLKLFLREWYMHPNGQIPAYEWALDDVNPPVHAWAVYRVYKLSAPRGKRDFKFLASCFHKLMLNFNWWVNRKDPRGKHLFSGGFLGLDNIGVFDRSKPLPTGGFLEQADGTSWVGFYAVGMLEIALELATHDPSYEDIASKFFEHFIQISAAMNNFGGHGLWDEEDGFYYDTLRTDTSEQMLKVRSMVGLIPLFAALVIDKKVLDGLPGFKARTLWFLENEKELAQQVNVFAEVEGGGAEEEDDEGKKAESRKQDEKKQLLLLTIPSKERLKRVLAYLFDEDEFFGPYGIRSLSKVHQDHPFEINVEGHIHRVDYCPGESNTSLFGGNSNWRGPVWFPVNYLLIEALERLHYAYGDSFKIEVPTGSGNLVDLKQASVEISKRLEKLFTPDETGKRPSNGPFHKYADDEHFKDLVLFYEYFDPDTGRGIGASHQTGWTGLITRCIDKTVKHERHKEHEIKYAKKWLFRHGSGLDVKLQKKGGSDSVNSKGSSDKMAAVQEKKDRKDAKTRAKAEAKAEKKAAKKAAKEAKQEAKLASPRRQSIV